MGIPLEEMVLWQPRSADGGVEPAALDAARVILWEGHCSVHAIFQPEHVDRIRAARPNIRILVHPECRMEVVDKADVVRSTEKIKQTIEEAPRAANGRSAPRSTW